MKRLLQVVALTQLALIVLIGVRIVKVVAIAPPEFAPPAPIAAVDPLPPKPRRRAVGKAVTEAVIAKNLFDSERGQSIEIEEEVVAEDSVPLPPPTNVKLNGIFFRGSEPVAIMTDTSVGTDQHRVRQGDMLGDYQIGEIGEQAVQLLGTGGQTFAVKLQLETSAAPVAPRPGIRSPRPNAATAAAARVQRNQAAAAARGAAARERAGETQRRVPGDRGVQHPAGKQTPKRDPVQDRLEALRRLREASRNR